MTRKVVRTRKRRRDRNFVAIPFTEELPLSTLADDTVLGTNLTGNFGEDLFVISIDGLWTLQDLTALEEPIEVGFAHNDLSLTEVKEALNAELTDPDDIIQKEHSRRPVRRAGIFSGVSSVNRSLNNGVKIRTKMLFMIGNDHGVRFWAFNKSGAPLTTGAVLHVSGTIFGRWHR